ncbi:cobyrinate a,c-diamide synthase [Alkaliphilus peptidifermentans]|uniref:Cobyrinate a,c-diamide synthase n=1 Tax=Alkaliphilus peptidifermentans DSM 18978 TaxID=1120976 RepID=A0A1G5ARJ4_9FIRM|nr:cobyrinate a,c-diamide synthase [Alkaliphilus peptidifermentans]SCX80516.1 cobyrinic acid a,c-diamide synthase [Alkaliphilus peptidifermentans DSM 18978]
MKSNGRIVIAGTHSGVGKTTITLGIMGALIKRRMDIKPFKVGPDYIDPQFHRRVTGNPSRNLDSYLLEESMIKYLFNKNCAVEDMAIIEGVMGLYDGLGTNKDQGSTAHISKILKSPVILIIDGGGMSSSAAAMVLGYKQYDEDVDLKGVIINNLSGEKHYKILQEAIERDTGIRCIGYLKKTESIELKSRHLGLIPCMEVPEIDERLAEIIAMVEETIDLDALISFTSKAEKLQNINEIQINYKSDVAIGYAYDEAFNFYYEDNLDILRQMGADLIPFSPLRDKSLPENIHGIYLGGGFPEVFSKELENNHQIREEILSRAQIGMPIYGECGGFMYLTEDIKNLDGDIHKMVGIFNVHSEMTNKLQRFGYVEVEPEADCRLFQNTGKIKAHEFHRSIVQNMKEHYIYQVSKVKDGRTQKRWNCGLEKNNCLGAYPHIHFYSNIAVPKAFIEKCEIYKNLHQKI